MQIAVLKLAIIVLSGALLGLWTVRRLVLTNDGLHDTNVAEFVACSFQLLASSFILQVPLHCFINKKKE